MKEEIVNKLNAIRSTAEIVLEHQSARVFKNHLISIAAQNIIGISEEAIDKIQKGKKGVRNEKG